MGISTSSRILGALLVAIPGWCGADTLQKVTSDNTVTVSFRESAIPFSYLTPSGQPTGLSVDLTEAIVAELRSTLKRPQLQVRYIPVNAQNRIPLLVNGNYDLECGSTTNNSARGREVAFSISFFYAGTGLLTKANDGPKNFSDLAGRSVATVGGSTNEKVLRQYATDHKLDVSIVLGKDYADALKLLQDGKASAVALDDVLLYGMRANAEDPASLAVVGESLQIEPYGCIVRKDDPAFKQLVDGVIAKMMTSGEFSRVYAKWFQSPIPPKGINLSMPMSAQLQKNLKELSDKPAQ